MAPTARNSGLTGGGLQSSCSTASNGRNSTPLCRQQSAMAPTARNSGLTGGGLQSSCSTASNGRNSTPLCRQRLPGAASGPPYASISSATTKPWCSAWCPAGHTARTSCPSSATSFLPPPCTISPYPHNTFLVCTTFSPTLSPASTCRYSAHMPHKPRPTQPPSPPLFPSTRCEALPAPLPCHIHTQHIQCSHMQFHQFHSHIQPTPPQWITHALRLISCAHPELQSIKVYLSAVRNLHLEHGLPDPMTDALNLRRLMRGIKRVHGGPADHRLPITPNLLHSFRRFLVLSHPDHLTLWEALLLAFFGFLRSNELLSLKPTDLTRIAEGYQVRIRASKTDPFCMGATIRISPTGDPSLCPVPVLDSQPPAKGRGHCFACRLGSL